MSLRNRRINGGAVRMFFFLSFFCVSAVIVFFTLGKIYGDGQVDVGNAKIGGVSSNAIKRTHQLTRLYPRSLEEREFLIIVFGWRRKESMERLVNSLLKADYLGKSVQIQFHIEFEPSKDVEEYVKGIIWPYGSKQIIWRHEPFGLERMVVESWKAENDNEFAFFFEDDIEVHSYYFKFALEALNRKEITTSEHLVGISFNTPRYDEVNIVQSIWEPEYEIGLEAKIFLFQQAASWGSIYFPWKWREYLKYYSRRRGIPGSVTSAEGVEIIPLSCVTEWKKSWKKYLMELMVLKGYLMLYPSLKNQESLSVHHREEGEHAINVDSGNKVVDFFVVPLVNDTSAQLLIDEVKTANFDELPIINFYHFKVDSIDDLKEFGNIVTRRI